MLMICGGALLFTKFCAAIRPPKVLVSWQAATMIVAFGAAAVAHSASAVVSISSPVSVAGPGSLQLVIPLGGAGWRTCRGS